MYKLLRDKKTKRVKELIINHLGVVTDNRVLNNITIKIVGVRVYKHSILNSNKISLDVEVSGTLFVYGDMKDVKDTSVSPRKKNSKIRNFFTIKAITNKLSYVYGNASWMNIEIDKIKYV
jgi:hypothetical protein